MTESISGHRGLQPLQLVLRCRFPTQQLRRESPGWSIVGGHARQRGWWYLVFVTGQVACARRRAVAGAVPEETA